MNLIDVKWIPVRHQSGKRELIAPYMITDETNDPVTEICSPRPDFDGALMQFLIGLFQTVCLPSNKKDWIDWIEKPPSSKELQKKLAKVKDCFDVEGKTAFMQDFDFLEKENPKNVFHLLIDHPGENGIKNNTDHFVKRKNEEGLCHSCIITALFTLQTNAPAGGQGHCTSLRGGGPLTTLVCVDENSKIPNTLWSNVWLNVLPANDLKTDDYYKGSDKGKTFPWMADNPRIKEDGKTAPEHGHFMQHYWGMPRRIRIDWKHEKSGACHICHSKSNHLVTQYRGKTHGIDYESFLWRHPLSPYYWTSTKEEKKRLPEHMHEGGLLYKNWLEVSQGSEKKVAANVVERYQEILTRSGDGQLVLHAFGYDMKSANSKCWYDRKFPLFKINSDTVNDIARLMNVAVECAKSLKRFTRTVRKGNFLCFEKTFYQNTETLFFEISKKLETGSDEDRKSYFSQWAKTLQTETLNLFDSWSLRGCLEQANLKIVMSNKNKLKNQLQRILKSELGTTGGHG